MGKEIKRLECCCEDLWKAIQDKTDSEGYGCLIWPVSEDPEFEADAGQWHAGCGLAPLSFCPWCGQKLPVILTPEERQAKEEYLTAKAKWVRVNEKRAKRNE